MQYFPSSFSSPSSLRRAIYKSVAARTRKRRFTSRNNTSAANNASTVPVGRRIKFLSARFRVFAPGKFADYLYTYDGGDGCIKNERGAGRIAIEWGAASWPSRKETHGAAAGWFHRRRDIFINLSKQKHYLYFPVTRKGLCGVRPRAPRMINDVCAAFHHILSRRKFHTRTRTNGRAIYNKSG